MQLRTLARDCLYVNWAIPHEAAPSLPSPLRYEVHSHDDRDWIFASALLFRLSGLHLESIPFARVSYPQMNLRLYVLDGRGMPSVLFLRLLVPYWFAPMSRLLGSQPATAATFSYPSPSEHPDEESWTWTVERRKKLQVHARMAAPGVPTGPQLGPWEQTVAYFRNRRRGYTMVDDRLRSLRTSESSVAVWPLEVEVVEAGLVSECFDNGGAETWARPHSAWLCPEIPFNFELGKPMRIPMPSGRIPAAEGLSSFAERTAPGVETG